VKTAPEDAMKKTGEIVLTALVLATLYCAMPKSNPSPLAGHHVTATNADQVLMIADGTDPMPIRR
jgi:hypothetical protein